MNVNPTVDCVYELFQASCCYVHIILVLAEQFPVESAGLEVPVPIDTEQLVNLPVKDGLRCS